MVPVEDPEVRSVVVNGILHANMRDTEQSWLLDGDNNYRRTQRVGGFCSQSFFMEAADPTILGTFSPARKTPAAANERSQ